jgi:beta-1,4-N-acetylglucosaminyltransferase
LVLSLAQSLWLVLRVRPQLILANGPGTALPPCLCAFALRALLPLPLFSVTVVFVESFCRVRSLSLTGRLLYPLADKFIVHWPQTGGMGRAELLGVDYPQ